MASNSGSKVHLELLLGMLVKVQNRQGLSALHWAARKNELKTAKLLLESPKFDVNLQDKNGSSILHLCSTAAADDSAPLLLMLLTGNGKVHIGMKNVKNKTALEVSKPGSLARSLLLIADLGKNPGQPQEEISKKKKEVKEALKR